MNSKQKEKLFIGVNCLTIVLCLIGISSLGLTGVFPVLGALFAGAALGLHFGGDRKTYE